MPTRPIEYTYTTLGNIRESEYERRRNAGMFTEDDFNAIRQVLDYEPEFTNVYQIRKAKAVIAMKRYQGIEV